MGKQYFGVNQFNYQNGEIAEKLAGEYLSKKGFIIIGRNFRTRFGEIDLVTAHGNLLVFIEVKLKVGEDYGYLEELLSSEKVRQMARNIDSYLVLNPQIKNKFQGCRVDVVCVVVNSDWTLSHINHYKNLVP